MCLQTRDERDLLIFMLSAERYGSLRFEVDASHLEV